MIEKIISGGQTGADQGGLEAGKELGIPTGGTAPMGWKTELGTQPVLLSNFGLVECSHPGFPFRTKCNILDSGGTVIFGDITSPGSALTLNLCRETKTPLIVNPAPGSLREWLECNLQIETLNVAGNRESKNPGIQKKVRDYLVKELKEQK